MADDIGATSEESGSMDDTIRATLADINSRAETPAELEATPIGTDTPADAPVVGKPPRARDESGKFAKATDTPVADPAAVAAVDQPAVDAPIVRKAPSSWKKDVVDKHWNTLPPDVQAYVEEREGQFHKGIEQYRAAAQFAQQMEKAVTPYMQTIQGLGVTPDVAVQKLFAADHALRYGSPEQKMRKVQDICRSYGVDIAQTQALPPVDPTVSALEQRLGQLQTYIQQQQNSQAEREAQSLNSEISAFAADPSHTYFSDVREDMAALLQAGRASSLQDAYEMAVRANPTTFARWNAEQQTKQREAAAQAAAKAKTAAAVNVSSKPAPAAAAVIGTMDDTIRSNYRRLMGTA